MYKRPTVFIVGAGASKELGLPDGRGLTTKIASRLNVSTAPHGLAHLSNAVDIDEEMDRHRRNISPNLPRDPYYRACQMICEAAPQMISIDNFLAQHDHDQTIKMCGKLAIAKEILHAESASKLNIPDGARSINFNGLGDTWLNPFFMQLAQGVTRNNLDSIFSNVSFVVFNYDRCVEHYLVNSIVNFYGAPASEAVALTNTLPIIHPYGSVGKLPWATHPKVGVQFGGHNNVRLLDVSEGLRTFAEELNCGNELSLAHNLISQAENLVFLGFAFHEQNVRLISPPGGAKAVQVFGTALQMSAADLDFVNLDIHALLSSGKRTKGRARIHLVNKQCHQLFQEFWRSLMN